MKLSAIILAAGTGSRMNLGYNKILHKINNETIIEKTVKTFLENEYINEIFIVVNENEKLLINKMFNNPKISIVVGGVERFNSVNNALFSIKNDFVLIHDGARCFITNDLINKIALATFKYDATCLGVISKDTIHICDADNNIVNTPNRDSIYLAQTPQGFKTSLIKEAYHNLLLHDDVLVTDDAMIVNKYTTTKVKMIPSEYSNIKITTQDDLQ